MSQIAILLASAIALEEYAQSIETKSMEMFLINTSIQRSRMWLKELVKTFTDNIDEIKVKSIDETPTLKELGELLKAFVNDLDDHLKSTQMNKKYEQYAIAAFLSAKEAIMWVDEHVELLEESGDEVEDKIITENELDTITPEPIINAELPLSEEDVKMSENITISNIESDNIQNQPQEATEEVKSKSSKGKKTEA